MTEQSKPTNRPRIVIAVTVVFAFYAVISMLIGAVSLVALISALLDPSIAASTSEGFAFVIAFIGLGVFVINFWKALTFYSLKRHAYIIIKSNAKAGPLGMHTDWLLWFVTKNGKRLDDKDVRDAFGLKEYDIF